VARGQADGVLARAERKVELPFGDFEKAGVALAKDPRNPAVWAWLDRVRAAL
jgi:hypothetical protein